MIDFINIAAKKLTEGKSVIFCSVGSYTFSAVKELQVRFGLKPTAVSDRNTKLSGRSFNGLNGVEVAALEVLGEKYPDCFFYIPSIDYKYSIIGQLVNDLNVSPDRIINYEEVEYVNSCSILEKQIVYDRDDRLTYCWDEPKLRFPYDVAKIADVRNNIQSALENNTDSEISTYCKKCKKPKKAYYPKDRKAWTINFFSENQCNLECNYCTVLRNNPIKNHSDRKLSQIIEETKRIGLVSDDYLLILSTGGEPLLDKRLGEYLDAFDGQAMTVNTNGTIFNDRLFELMNRKIIHLVISLDSGTPQTFKQIKGKDLFEKVKTNIIKYSAAKIGLVVLKYVIVPGMNDKAQDIDGFIDLAMQANISIILLALDYFSIEKIDDNTIAAVSHLKKRCFENGIFVSGYDSAESAEYTEKIQRIMEV
jgi:wyosine [tRNA(Phe)-imidazoG37] synthetase (radical SAM superfamily)